MLPLPMRPPGTFKLLGRARRQPGGFDPHAHYASRSDRIVDSLRHQILEPDEEQSLRIRQIFEEPKEIYRIEIERPERGYQRTTLLDRDALEDLLATDDVRERFLATASPSRAATVESVQPFPRNRVDAFDTVAPADPERAACDGEGLRATQERQDGARSRTRTCTA